MATVAERRDAAGRSGEQVDDQIAQATARIKAHDLALGGLLLAAVVLAYAAGMILLDQALVLPEWVRQLGLAGFALTVAGVGYLAVVRPLSRRVNPLYAAVRVERTLDDPKNTVSGYVEARDRDDVPEAVRAAMAGRAARSAGQADVNRAVDHRSLLYAGGAAVALLLTLVVLFFVFRPAQFTSLLGRAFVPFSSDPIATRTRLDLLEPAGGNLTVTAGQSVTVKVHVGGKVPAADGPDRLRVRLRHTPDGDYEDLPLEQAESSRDWQARIPEGLIRNGVWYAVAGGDDQTPEYKVTVRSVPKFTDFEVNYEYPKYVRREPRATTDAHLEGYRGTKVTLIGKTNRTAVKDGRLSFDPPVREPVAGVPVPGRPDALKFEFRLTAPGSYRLGFTSDEGERAPDSAPFGIRLIDDFAPTVEIVEPKEDEVPVPANGTLEVDGRVGDDFGIDKVTLRLKVVEPREQELAPKPYQGGKSYRRERDDTWPQSLAVKDSVDFTKLTDPAGKPVALSAGMVLEYWLEATDNCTTPGPAGDPEPDPNVGRSKAKRVRVTPPPAEPERQQKQAEQKDKRQAEEQKHNQQQDQKLDKENREPQQGDQPPPQPQDGNPPRKEGDQQPENGGQPEKKKNDLGNGAKQPKDGMPPKKGDEPPAPKNEGQQGTDPGNPDQKKGGDPKTGDTPPPGGQQDPGNTGQGKPPEAPPPMPKDRSEVQKQADKVQQELDNQANRGGDPKPNPAEQPGEPQPPAEAKPRPQDGDPSATDKAEPKGGQSGGSTSPAESKPEGNAAKPENPADQKPEPKGGESGTTGGSPTAEPKPQPQPQGGPPSGDKPTPKPNQKPGTPQPKDGPRDPSGGGEAKPPGSPEAKSDGTPNPAPKDGGAGQPKPMPQPGAGDKPPADPSGGAQQPQPGGAKPESGGDPKPQAAPQPADAKPAPKDDAPMPGGGGEQQAGEPKPAPSDAGGDPNKGAGEAKPPPQAQPQPKDGAGNTAQGKPPGEPGTEKPAPDARTAKGQKPDPKRPDPSAKGGPNGQPKEPTPEQKQEFEQAVKNLNSPNAETRQAARDKLDQQVGKENRQEIEDIAKGMNSDKPEERAAAEQKLKDLKEKADRMAGKGGAPKADKTDPGQGQKTDPKGGTAGNQKLDPKEMEKALNDLNSKDAAAQQAARDKLDKAMGEGARKEAEQAMKDRQSDDPDRRAAAEQKLKDMQQANKGGEPKKGEPSANKGGGEPKKGDASPGKKPDPAAVEQALRDLNNPDPKVQADAKQKLDEQLGKGAGDEAEQAAKDARSDDFAKQGQGRQKLDDIQNRAEQMAKGTPDPKAGGQGKPLSPEEQAELAKKLDALNSNDPATRQAAEKEFDDKLGKENREKLQEAMNDPQKAKELQDKLKEMAEAKRGGGDDPDGRPPEAPGASSTRLNPEAVADAKARAQSAQLQLDQFEKNKGNKDLLDRLGMTDDEYERFLDGFRKNAAALKKEAEEMEKAEPLAPGTPTQNVGSGGKVEKRGGPAAGQAGVGSAGAAPADARDALDKFRRGAVKVVPKK